jgi:molecular chaperone DnaK
VTRKEFEPLILDKISSSAAQIKNALYDADLQANDMDLVLLVGGSTKIPLVSDFLTETLDFDPQSFVDPDLAVVRGAAIQAGIMEGLFADNPIVLTDVCPYSLSTDVIMSSLFGEMLRCDILIPRNTTIPATESKVYVTSHDDQTSVDLSAFQGESTLPEDNILLNKFRLGGVPKARAGKEKIKVIFTYDLNAVLTVTGEVVSTGKSATIQINTATTGRNLDLSQWTDAKPARKYRAMIHRAEQMLESDALDPLDRDDIDRALTELKEGLILGWDAEMLDDCKEFLMSLLRHAETEME